MSRDFKIYLYDIFDRANRILENTRDLKSPSELENDEWTEDAIVRNLEIMGEAAKQIPEEFCAKYPEVPWREMKGLRDRLIHQYFEVSLLIIWDILKNELPEIISNFQRIIDDLEKLDQ